MQDPSAGEAHQMMLADCVDPLDPVTVKSLISSSPSMKLFMAAAKAQDIQALGQVWGSATGPILATISSAEVEQRAIYVMCHLKQDSYQILGESPAPGGERVFALEVKFKDLTASTHFNAIRGPAERWYVRTLELEPLRDICAKK